MRSLFTKVRGGAGDDILTDGVGVSSHTIIYYVTDELIM